MRAARALGAVTRGARIATGATMAAMVACVGVIDERQSRSLLVFWFGAIFWRDNLETAEVLPRWTDWASRFGFRGDAKVLIFRRGF